MYLIDTIHKTAEKNFVNQGQTLLILQWVPGHMDIEGNKRSNVKVKAAAREESSKDRDLPRVTRGQLPFSRLAV